MTKDTCKKHHEVGYRENEKLKDALKAPKEEAYEKKLGTQTRPILW